LFLIHLTEQRVHLQKTAFIRGENVISWQTVTSQYRQTYASFYSVNGQLFLY